jgi:type III pantothenate kinase
VTALLIDVGNTRLKWGVLEDGGIRRTGHISHANIREAGLAALTSKLPRGVDAAMASNVAGTSFATRLAGVIGLHCGCDVHFARSERSACGVTNGYRLPRRLGVDRWVAMIGAWAEFRKPCLVVDAGTAVTIDAIGRDGQHLGGQILPGVMLMREALAGNTSELPKVTARSAKSAGGMDIFGNSTAAAITHGTFAAVVGSVEHAVAGMREGGIRKPAVVLTGGDASRILTALGGAPSHRPHLVLQGLAELLDEPR